MCARAPLWPVVHCTGAPRDLGFDQGIALAPRIAREALRETPRAQPARWFCEHAPTRHARAVRRAWRDTKRHFPHMAERALGLARGGGVSTFALAGLLARAGACAPSAVRVFESEEGLLLARVLEAPRDALALRHSAPAPGYASAEVTLAWQTPALLGVNAHGLAVSGARAEEKLALSISAARFASEQTSPRVRELQPSACAAPAVLLVQDCLQRFDTVAKALEWIARRPAAGGAELWLADAHGARARVRVTGAAGAAREVHCEEWAARALPSVADDAALAAALGAEFSLVAQPLAVAELATRRVGVLLPGSQWVWSAALTA